MIVAQISDTHIFLPEPSGSARLNDLALAVKEINQLDSQPDVIIHSGDISHNATLEEYLAAKELLNQLKAPLFVIPGNRDRREIMGKTFSGHIGECKNKNFIQYELGNWDTRLLLLDTLDENDRVGAFCEDRLENLFDMLRIEPEKPTAIFMHHPPYDVLEAPEPFQFDNRSTLDKLAGILEKNSNIIGIFCGHSHRTTTGTFAGFPASTIAALSIDLRFGEFPASHKDRPVFAVHEF